MNAIMTTVLELLPLYGPWLLFALAVLETSFVTGLVVPSGVATSAATVLALEGTLELVPVLTAATAGGFVGDSIGFWIGRRWGPHVFSDRSRWGRRLTARRHEVDDLFERHPLFSVTCARLVSFVRTLMPMAAGMSDLPYRTYLPFEAVGVVAWAGLYAAIGFAGRESWEVATRVVGAGGAVAFVVVSLIVLSLWRRRGARGRGAQGGAA